MRIFDVLIVGGGRSGLEAARLIAAHGLEVAVVERSRIGGRHRAGGQLALALRDVGAAIADARDTSRLGLDRHEPSFRFSRVARQLRALAAEEPGDDRAGIEIVPGEARFERVNVVTVGDQALHGKAVIVATGSREQVPDVPGLTPALSVRLAGIADLSALPESIAFLGASPESVVAAQAMARLGSRVTLVRLDGDAGTGLGVHADDLLEQVLTADGVEVIAGLDVVRVSRDGEERTLELARSGAVSRRLRVRVLVVTPRLVPDIESLQLRRAGIEGTSWGIHVDDQLRSSVRSIWGIGGAAGEPCLAADGIAQARHVAQIVAGGDGGKFRASGIVRTIETDPEVAVVGVEARDVEAPEDTIVAEVSWMEGGRPGRVRLVASTDGTLIGAVVVGRTGRESATVVARAVGDGETVVQLASSVHDGPVGAAVAAAARELVRKRRVSTWTRVAKLITRRG